MRQRLGIMLDWFDGYVVNHRVYLLCRLICWLVWPDESYDRAYWKTTRNLL